MIEKQKIAPIISMIARLFWVMGLCWVMEPDPSNHLPRHYGAGREAGQTGDLSANFSTFSTMTRPTSISKIRAKNKSKQQRLSRHNRRSLGVMQSHSGLAGINDIHPDASGRVAD
ncbi:MAG: hypothetical protein P8N14_10975 [Sulfitobacter sp.]|jgi:hypothetical protein|nr:hypothetical protein [Sulfitobacter sp.]